jgi:alpha-ribazole phosphatase
MGVIYLIRHAAPELQGVFLGSTDSPLASESVPPSALAPASIFASPLRRAKRTAELLFPGREMVILPDLAECSFGDWEGKTWDEVQQGWPELAGQKVSDWRRVTPPNGESWADFSARIDRAWSIIRRAPRPAAIVAHGGVNSVLAYLIAGRDPFNFQQGYCEVLTLESPD